MQQLIHWRVEPMGLIADHVPFVETVDFIDWAKQLIAQQGCSVGSIEFGADRAQVGFRYENLDFLLCFESLCESIWIESIQHSDDVVYTRLLERLNEQ